MKLARKATSGPHPTFLSVSYDNYVLFFFFFFFNDTATTEIYTLSLHDALPICGGGEPARRQRQHWRPCRGPGRSGDRKSTRLNSSHLVISYAVFCLKKKKNEKPSIKFCRTC